LGEYLKKYEVQLQQYLFFVYLRKKLTSIFMHIYIFPIKKHILSLSVETLHTVY